MTEENKHGEDMNVDDLSVEIPDLSKDRRRKGGFFWWLRGAGRSGGVTMGQQAASGGLFSGLRGLMGAGGGMGGLAALAVVGGIVATVALSSLAPRKVDPTKGVSKEELGMAMSRGVVKGGGGPKSSLGMLGYANPDFDPDASEKGEGGEAAGEETDYAEGTGIEDMAEGAGSAEGAEGASAMGAIGNLSGARSIQLSQGLGGKKLSGKLGKFSPQGMSLSGVGGRKLKKPALGKRGKLAWKRSKKASRMSRLGLKKRNLKTASGQLRFAHVKSGQARWDAERGQLPSASQGASDAFEGQGIGGKGPGAGSGPVGSFGGGANPSFGSGSSVGGDPSYGLGDHVYDPPPEKQWWEYLIQIGKMLWYVSLALCVTIFVVNKIWGYGTALALFLAKMVAAIGVIQIGIGVIIATVGGQALLGSLWAILGGIQAWMGFTAMADAGAEGKIAGMAAAYATKMGIMAALAPIVGAGAALGGSLTGSGVNTDSD